MIYTDIGLEYQSHQLLLNPTVDKPLSLQMLDLSIYTPGYC